MPVTRCICFDVTFADIMRIAQENGGNLGAAHKITGCGARCGLCVPYIRYMAQTGETEMPVMWGDDFRRQGIIATQIERLERFLAEQESKARKQHSSSAQSA